MKYLMMIYSREEERGKISKAEMQVEMQAYGEFYQNVSPNHTIHGGEALQSTSTATTVSIRDGKTIATDGPFAETHEQLGGFYLVDCENLDDAIEVAAQIPGALHGHIEVRPVMAFE